MSEPNLINVLEDLKGDIAYELGYTRTESKWSAERVAHITRMLKQGYSRFLFPEMLPGEAVPHKWSFLEPNTEIVVWGTTTGTIAGAPVYDGDALSTVTVATQIFYPSMLGASMAFDTSGNSYEIDSYVSATVVRVLGDASAETGDITITPTGDYSLPDDYGGIVGDFHIIGQDQTFIRVRRRGVGQIQNLRANYIYNSTPTQYAIVPRVMTGARGQRQAVMMYPTPDKLYTLTYRYSILPDTLSTSFPYPRGIEAHSQTLRAACLAEVEMDKGGGVGYEEKFLSLLVASINRDRRDNMPDNIGQNRDRSTFNTEFYYDRTLGATITRNGVDI